MKIANVAVLIDQEAAAQRWKYGMNVFEGYLEEILDHRGIAHQTITSLDELDPDNMDVLLVALAKEDEESADILWNFANQGGCVFLYANMNKLAKRIGYVKAKHFATGYIEFPGWDGVRKKLKFFDAIPWYPQNETHTPESNGETHVNEWGCVTTGAKHTIVSSVAALLAIQVGKGLIDRWSIPIMNTIVALQQGAQPVFEDGYPALDGTASVDDDILKADDQIAMAWTDDRTTTETGTPYFAYPHADEWRDQCISHLLRRVTERQMTLPFTGYWPVDIEAVAMISHDSDGNVEEHGETTLRFMNECDVKSSWCMIEPGYSEALYERIKKSGHEIAFHYDAFDQEWSESEFARQLDHLKKKAQLNEIISNKNHITRFEGWGELFKWCEVNGVQSDQTRGPSKKGNVGFLFGTCHPYFPIAWSNEQNRTYDVLEIGFLTQDMDLGKWADSSVIKPFLDTVKRMEGVAHFLFHQVHLHERPAVRESLFKVVKEARKRGFVFWTGEQINRWERARRKMKVKAIEQMNIHIQGQKLNDAVVWIPIPEGAGREWKVQDGVVARHYGILCQKFVVNMNKQ